MSNDVDLWHPKSLEDAKAVAKRMAQYAKDSGAPVAMEVVKTKTEPFHIQPFGMHALFKSHKLLYVEPIPA